MAASLVALVVVMWPFLLTLVVAGVVAVLTHPTYLRLAGRIERYPRLAAALMTGSVVLLLAVPLAAVITVAVNELVQAAESALRFLTSGGLDRFGASLDAIYARLRTVPGLHALLPEPEKVLDAVSTEVQGMLVRVVRAGSSGLAGALGTMGRVSIDLLVFCVSLFTCYLRADALLQVPRNLSPLRPDYTEHLFQVVAQLSTNLALVVVVGSGAHGVVAAAGFALTGGLLSPVALGLLTAVASLLPVVGSAVVYVPVLVALGLLGRWGAVAFLLVWSIVLTAAIDTVLRPVLLRSRLEVSPVLMMLSVLGGVMVLGGRGLILGPAALLMFLTTYTLYVRDFVRGDG